MPSKIKARTIGELRGSGYKFLTVREELRKNLVNKLKKKQEMFPGIIGFDETVLPQLQNAILAGQDIVLLGERGQAKSRLIRHLVSLLDREIPVVAGCEINDNPHNPICKACEERLKQHGDDVEIDWLPREARYSEKLATPDISIADLIGEIDPIKVAEGRYLSDELTIHFGLIPRSNRGIFSINELPDLAERIQVGMFNLMEERDVQIKGYRIRLPLDVYVVATANPEDYTNRGRIITPLKDRYGAQIRTHYPRNIHDEITIMEQERSRFPSEKDISTPQYMKEIIAEITSLARRSSDINQRSGVSVRVSIANYETVVSNALRRAILQGEEKVSPRISDLPYILASFAGKIELETFEDGREYKIMEDLSKKAVLNVFKMYFDAGELETIVQQFDEGAKVETGSDKPSDSYVEMLDQIEGLSDAVNSLGAGRRSELVASAAEFVLEGLHLNRKLNRDQVEKGFRYRS
ncbi:MAG: magnesium chelatase [Dehalococcoidia bacterium]|nr:magnesium chelatase [Dehalococcoidia bacterium]